MFGDRHAVAFLQLDQLIAFKLQRRAAAHDDYPLVPVLIIPKARRTAVGVRNDSLDLGGRIFEKSQEIFSIRSLWKLRKNISGAPSHASLSQARAPDSCHVDDSLLARWRRILERRDYRVDHLLDGDKS
jgi:hypothetical protein